MADGHWMEKAFSKNKGALHKQLGVKTGTKIPKGKLAKAAHAKGKLGERARAAENAAKVQAHRTKTMYGK
jgi:hypothetical protein